MFRDITFAHPDFLFFLGIIPLLIAWYIYVYRRKRPHLTLSDSAYFTKEKKSLKQKLFFLQYVFRFLAIACIIVALARPQSSMRGKEENIEGVDIVLALDASGSMIAEDLKPNRLEAAKSVAANFIQGRENDRMALVIFSGETFTLCPLTIDHRILLSQLDAVKSGMITDGTAIGDGLATAVSRLRNSDAISKTIILITDGINNAGSLDPQTAAEMAKLYNIRIYTIGVGTRGLAPYPYQTPWGKQYVNEEVKIDEDLLKSVASSTGGKYFRATSKNVLENIFTEINKMEKSKIEVLSFERKTELFKPLVWLALGLLLLELIGRYTIFKSLP